MKKHTERKKYVEDALKKTIIQNYSFIEAVDGEIDRKIFCITVLIPTIIFFSI